MLFITTLIAIMLFITFNLIQEEYLDALNKQEIAKKELDASIRQKNETDCEIQKLKGEMTKGEDLYKEEDELLGEIWPSMHVFSLFKSQPMLSSTFWCLIEYYSKRAS